MSYYSSNIAVLRIYALRVITFPGTTIQVPASRPLSVQEYYLPRITGPRSCFSATSMLIRSNLTPAVNRQPGFRREDSWSISNSAYESNLFVLQLILRPCHLISEYYQLAFYNLIRKWCEALFIDFELNLNLG